MTVEEKRQRSIRLLVVIVVSVVSFAAGTRYEAIFATIAPVLGARVSSDKLDLTSVQETYQQLLANYDGKLDKQKLIYGASRGLAEASGDRHTVYMDPDEAKEFNKSLSGNIGGGIGAEIGLRNKQPAIIRPLNDSPAKEAGIKAGELIIKVNNDTVTDWTVDRVVEKVRGEIGTSVKLTLFDGAKMREVSVVRRDITAPAVETRIENGIGIMKVNRFGNDTVSLARRAAEDFMSKNVSKVILDLRDNPGGTVSSAQGLLGIWINRQTVLTERRGSEVVKTLHSTGAPLLSDVKTIVLINGNSASASEITAGALKEYGKAILVGQKSYGKGSVQSVVNLSGGAQLKVTEARWYTPKGKNIDGEGIEPDEKIEMTAEDLNNNRDPQLDKAKSL